MAQVIDEPEIVAPEQDVAVEPIARDEAIAARLDRILDATGWYRAIDVTVDEGVVFVSGIAGSQEQRTWARDLAARTEGVVAVVNHIEVREEVSWNIAPALSEVEALARRIVVTLPLILLAVLILPVAWWLSSRIASLMRRVLAPRVEQTFLRDVIARGIAVPVLLLGVYLVLQVAGLTGLAVSLLGGAGVIGIVLGFAFRDIAENFLASLILSIRQPFRSGDVIGVAGFEGVVQTMNTRSTILLTIDGNHVQIPNATVFKSTIVNYTAAPARRVTAEVGIGYDASVEEAQTLIATILRSHDAILHEPPPMVLVDALGSSTVNLKAHFWIDGRTLSPLRVRSSALRLIMRVLVENGISMPDEAREIIFPDGVPLVEKAGALQKRESEPLRKPIREKPVVGGDGSNSEASVAEGGLGSEMTELPSDIANGTIPEAADGNLLDRPS
ncbi:mechanosensitive ion channel family protein [Fulvimarina sp. 2208YS6-2-32]|uniref:Small-conductance mechanosensitive channel n=1 Tax=Fulvimarina uroteuthidis TaxID=3098149 RepID=A0ABU5I3E8_9HYPH|nr:mechanosensitive ion channel family protein [Fulvimarina sp. 2208YS6-2-32]MDY8109889.1 mechanosensitive ion channel family protein [Fulvimarina sp. 2208YS6-2-32]